MEGSLNWKQSEMLPFLNLMFLNPDICVKESCINAGDLFRCIDGAELKELWCNGLQWEEKFWCTQCVTHWVAVLTQKMAANFLSMKQAPLICRSAVKLKIDGPSGKRCTPHFMACKSKNLAFLLSLHCIHVGKIWFLLINWTDPTQFCKSMKNQHNLISGFSTQAGSEARPTWVTLQWPIPGA